MDERKLASECEAKLEQKQCCAANGGGTVYSIDQGGGKSSCVILKDISPTLACTHYGEPAVAYEREDTCPE